MGVFLFGIARDSKRAPKAQSVSDSVFGSKQPGGLFAQREENPFRSTKNMRSKDHDILLS